MQAKAGRTDTASRFPHVRAFLQVLPGEREQQDRTVLSRLPYDWCRTYCGKRLHSLGAECTALDTPHQLRASFAMLLLNAGAPVLTVQALLGHKHVDTTMRYARVHDSTVAQDYVRAAGKGRGLGRRA